MPRIFIPANEARSPIVPLRELVPTAEPLIVIVPDEFKVVPFRESVDVGESVEEAEVVQ